MSTARFVMIIGVAITAIATTNHAPALAQEAAPAPAADSGVFRRLDSKVVDFSRQEFLLCKPYVFASVQV